jgi:hypothetical protein
VGLALAATSSGRAVRPAATGSSHRALTVELTNVCVIAMPVGCNARNFSEERREREGCVCVCFIWNDTP